jgi:hypothetical protein
MLLAILILLKFSLEYEIKTSIHLQNDPQLAQAILGDDINALQDVLRLRHKQRFEMRRKQEEELVRNRECLNTLK